ncbi:MAG: alanine dehydrogenase [Candidatus Eisenbacteria bacterium]|nr:alanine dehydrogenase [Candidatus Eisenbacteria bacterium]MCC7142508.1 alanine dehydrogenase [Candidatus Eisenbacteria bacterium]
MEIGVAREIGRDEHRVALTPAAARQLVMEGHRVFVERDAGLESRFTDREYREAGAEILYAREEVIRRSGVVLGLGAPSMHDAAMLEAGQVVFGFQHLAVAPKELLYRLLERRITAIGFELIEEPDGRTPILRAMSELGGQMVVHLAAHLLEAESQGRGILLGAVPGIGPASVLVLGAGTVGRTAARILIASGAHVVLLDRDLERLRRADQELSGRAETFIADPETLAKFTRVADVVIGAVRVPGGRAPYLVSRAMVSEMRPGSVIIDVAIDQGGCVETSRPTTLAQPTFAVNEVVHYCVPNFTANIPRTASKVLSLTHLPYVAGVARTGIEAARRKSEPISRGIYLHDGGVLLPDLAARLGM